MTEKKKAKVQASDVEVANRRLDAVLADLAEQIKTNDARYEERQADNQVRLARLEEAATVALQELRTLTQELREDRAQFRAFTQEIRTWGRRTDARFEALEKAS
jgi:hypothetical protein